jgi:GT2 family glycosyltransferase/SAM-dependent methyltransferase
MPVGQAMTAMVRKMGYAYDDQMGIWARTIVDQGIGARALDIERQIATLLERVVDLSVLSTDLRRACSDWEVSFLLNSARANLLRPFGSFSGKDVLEIGSGCGTLTRYLGEGGANVLALERKPTRAAITRSRCRDLENVTVLAERFENLECEHRFDVITLAGEDVWPLCDAEETGEPHELFQRIRQLLRPQGTFILATENQLGLRSFAGTDGDSQSRSVAIIEGRRQTGFQPPFGRRTLAEALKKAGFPRARFLFPFPDHRLPVSVLTETGFSAKDFDAGALVGFSVRRDSQSPGLGNFSLELAWPGVVENGLGADLANSFLAAASPYAPEGIEENVLAYHYSTDRVAGYCKTTTFVRDSDGGIRVKYVRLGEPAHQAGGRGLENAAGEVAPGAPLRFVCPDSKEYQQGTPLATELTAVVATQHWSFEDVGSFVRRYVSLLENLIARDGLAQRLSSPDVAIPGQFIDAVPPNVILDARGEAALIDREWVATKPVELGHLLMRALLLFLDSVSRISPSRKHASFTRGQFVNLALAAAGLDVSKEDYARYLQRERLLQEAVSGIPAPDDWDWGIDDPVILRTLAGTARELEAQLHDLRRATNAVSRDIEHSRALADRETDLKRVLGVVSQRDKEILGLSEVVSRRDRSLTALHQQVSERDVRISRLAQEVSQRDRDVASLHGQISLRDHDARRTSRDIAKRGARIDRLLTNLAARDLRISDLVEQVEEGDSRYRAILTSRTWRLTEPLRWLGPALKSIPSKVSLALRTALGALRTLSRPGGLSGASILRLFRVRREAALLEESGLFDADHFVKTVGADASPGLSPVLDYLLGEKDRGAEPHPLFDTGYYLSRYPDVESGGLNPLVHFVRFGRGERRSPSAWFDTEFYLKAYADVAATDVNPLIDYVRHGAAKGRDPNPWFDTSWYVQKNPDVTAAGMNPLAHFIHHGSYEGRDPSPWFDTRFYLCQVGEAPGADPRPFVDFLERGVGLSLDPAPLFDTGYYVSRYPEVSGRDENPYLHFLREGKKAGHVPTPWFDDEFYRQNYPDVSDWGWNPLAHYLEAGAREGRRPNPWFDVGFYAMENPDVLDDDTNPLAHFVFSGMWEGRDPNPLFKTSYYRALRPDDGEAGLSAIHHFLKEGSKRGLNPHPLFNTRYYLACYPDVAESGMNPWIHYLRFGHKEGRRPMPIFDSRFYLADNPDVAASGFNPLAHFVLYGEAEGRNPHPLFFTSYYRHENKGVLAEGLNSLEHYWRFGRFAGCTPNPWRLEPLSLEIWDSLQKHMVTPSLRLDPVPSFRPSARPLVSIIIPVFNHLATTINCLRAVADTTGPDAEIILVDDHSSDDTEAVLGRVPGLRYIRNQTNQGFLRSCNRAAQEAKGEYLVFLNNDTIPLSGWLDELLKVAQRPMTGLVGSALLFPDGALQEAGGLIWEDGSGWNVGRNQSPERPEYQYVREVDYCSGASVMVPAKAWRELAGFDEAFAPAYYEDTDFCFRLRAAGYRVLVQPKSKVVHIEGVSSGTSLDSGVKSSQARNQPIFYERWKRVLSKHGHWSNLRPGFRDRYAQHQTLLVDASTPRADHDSGSVDTIEYLRFLTETGHHVVFAAAHDWRRDGAYTDELQQLGVECLYGPFTTSVEEFLGVEGARFDLVLLFRVEIANQLIECVRARAPRARVVFATVDLHSLRAAREAELRGDRAAAERAQALKELEFSLITRFDHTILWSRHELDLIRDEYPGAKAGVVRFGRAIPGRSRPFGERKDFVFVGGFRHTPNLDAVRFFVKKVWPLISRALPESRFVIAGSNAGPKVLSLASESIIVRGFVADLGEFFGGARISVAPLRYGAGVKGKVVSSLSYGVPVVGTDVAFEGMELTSDDGAFGAADPEKMAALAISLYTSESLWTEASDAALLAVKRLYSVEAFRRQLADALRVAGFGSSGEAEPDDDPDEETSEGLV